MSAVTQPRSPGESGSRSRIAAQPAARYRWYVRIILALQQRKYGAALAPALLWGRLPRAFLALTLLYRAIDRASSPLEPGLRSLLQVHISRINGCAFCVDFNSAAAVARQVAAPKLAAFADHDRSQLFTERERAALAYAEAVTLPASAAAEAGFERLRAHFSEQEILELTALIAFQNLSSKFNAALGVPTQGFCATDPEARRTEAHEPSNPGR